ncbi:extracellular solute-binding protein [Citricoccus sp. NPDC055426]|uniref:ABC transporter substrate-binding protein n=1 Tax=Citricoccus sp. NPDC055426 TaxID=3155536 RepID=UPI003443FDD0
MKRSLQSAVLVAVAIGLAGTMSACSPGNASGPVAEGASGTVVWYSSHNPTQNEAVVTAFQEANPDIHVEVLRLVTGELATRYGQERASGQASADLVTLSDPVFVESGADEGWWDTDVPTAEGWPEDQYADGVATIGYLPLLLGYNTDSLGSAEAPQEWKDLTDPKYRGRLIMPDVRNDPAYLSLMQLWTQEYGDDFLSGIAAQDPQFVSSVVPGNESLGAGSGDVLAPNAVPSATTMIDAGAPIELLQPEPTTGIEYYTMITSNAENPAAAATLYEFLTSKEGQQAYNGAVGASPREDVEGTASLPEDYVQLRDLLPAANDRRDEIVGLLGIQ